MGARLSQEVCPLHLRLRGAASVSFLGAGGVGKRVALDHPSLPRQTPEPRRPVRHVSGAFHRHYGEQRWAVDGDEVRRDVLKEGRSPSLVRLRGSSFFSSCLYASVVKINNV